MIVSESVVLADCTSVHVDLLEKHQFMEQPFSVQGNPIEFFDQGCGMLVSVYTHDGSGSHVLYGLQSLLHRVGTLTPYDVCIRQARCQAAVV